MKDGILFIFLAIFGLLIGTLFILYPAPPDRMLNIQNYLITVGGIISAFVIAYLSSKIFSLRSERDTQQMEIDKLSEKLTHFRKLLYYTMKSRDFWNNYDHIAMFKKNYQGLTYERLHEQSDEKDELAARFWTEETELALSTIDLYCAMETISGPVIPEPGYLSTWHINKAVSFDYSIDELGKFSAPCSLIWYYLEGRYAKYGQGHFNDTGIWEPYQSSVIDIMVKINPKYKGKDFHRTILAEIATDFQEFYLPRLLELTRKNIGVPKSLIRTFNSLLFIMLFGVLLPIILQSLNVRNSVNVFLTLIFVWATSLGLLEFLFGFYNFLYDEVSLRNEKKKGDMGVNS